MGKVVRFRGVKATPKSLEKEILTKAGRLADDPSLLIPKCEGKCWRCPFDKMLKKMEKVQRHRDDPEQLQSMATYGDQLVRAYAATISLAASGKIPFMTTKQLPSGSVSFAVRGKVDPEKLIGVQYLDDPELRLLAYWEEARAQNLHIYSSGAGLWCSSEGPSAPKEYVEEMISLAPYDFQPDGTCGHPESISGLVIRWSSAEQELFVCQDCAGDVNLLHHLASRIAAPDPLDDFQVDVRYSPRCSSTSAVCGCRERSPLDQGLLNDYKASKIDDQTLISKARDGRKSRLRSHGHKVLVLGDACYQGNVESFLANLKGSEAERKAVNGLLRSKQVTVVTESDQAGKVIAELWSDHQDELLAQVASADVIRQLRSSSGNMTPAQVVNEGRRIELAKSISSRLPEYEGLGELASVADTLARAFKVEGKAAMVRALDRVRLKDHKSKAVAYGFLAAAGEAEGKNWQFTKEEVDYGLYLKDFAFRMLEGEGDDYDEAMRTLLSASGSSEAPKKKR